MLNVTSKEQQKNAQAFRGWYSQYYENEDLIKLGAYSAGTDPLLDKAIEKRPSMLKFLRQNLNEPCNLADSLRALGSLC